MKPLYIGEEEVKPMTIPTEIHSMMKKLLDVGYETYVIGGAVRDYLLDKPVHDYDIFTNATGEQILKVFPHGVVLGNEERQKKILTVVVNGTEISQFRQSGDRKETGTNLKAHCLTCDFTINAIAVDIYGMIHDPIGAIEDIDSSYLEFVGDAEKRIDEDEGRMIRYPRISGKADKEMTNENIELINKNIKRLDNVAPTRIHDELMLLFGYDNGVHKMHRLGMLTHLFPDFIPLIGMPGGGHHKEDGDEHSFEAHDYISKVTSNPLVKIGGTFHDIGKPICRTDEDGEVHFYNHETIGAEMVWKQLEKYNFSKSEMKFVNFLIKNHMYTYKNKPSRKSYIKFFANMEDHGVDILDYMAVIYGDFQGNKKKKRLSYNEFLKGSWIYQNYLEIKYTGAPFRIKDLEVKGTDIMGILKIEPGPVIGLILRDMFAIIAEGDLPNKRPELLHFLKSRPKDFLEDYQKQIQEKKDQKVKKKDKKVEKKEVEQKIEEQK